MIKKKDRMLECSIHLPSCPVRSTISRAAPMISRVTSVTTKTQPERGQGQGHAALALLLGGFATLHTFFTAL